MAWFGGFLLGAAVVGALWVFRARRPGSARATSGVDSGGSAQATSGADAGGSAPVRLAAELAGTRAELDQTREALAAAEGRLEGAQADMVNAAKMAALGQLVAGVAHEINTPMGALNSNHDVIRRALEKLQVILEDERVDEHELEEVRRIVKAVGGVQRTNAMAVERMGHIVRSLRTFGRPDRSEVGPLDLPEAIDSTLTILGHEVRGRIEIVKEYGQVPPVTCYPNRINQVFMNLLMNACQAIPESGTITVNTQAGEAGTVAVRISDTGVGIAPDALERIFEPGFTTKGARVGMGMGLLISRQIVEQHNGSLSAESQIGQGTTFTLVLPVSLAPTPQAAEA